MAAVSEPGGKVYLIGAGPGDPGLFTLKGRRCLEEADVVVYDYLANPRLLRYVKPDAEVIYVGKRAGQHTLPQEEIGRLLVEHAHQGKVVARLKGGDPFIFGRGGEEAEELAAAHIPFEVVPGVTSAVAAPAYAGIPLTHRDFTSTVAFVTGHEDPTKEETGIAWDKIATGIGTLVFFMGVGQLPEIVMRLTQHGRSPATPAAVIRWGTWAGQEVVTGTLADLPEKCRGMQPPALIVVGEVVALREKLRWFEAMPLSGKRILITRAREQASSFARVLEAAGAEVVEFPTITFAPPESWGPLDAAIARLREYQWVIFTSRNGVRFFWERMQLAGRDARDLFGMTVCAIGPATAGALQSLGVRADIVPAEFKAEALVEAIGAVTGAEGMRETRVLLARAAEAREVLPEELTRRGARVDVVAAYRTVKSASDAEALRTMLREGKIHAVTFTSSSTVKHFLDLVGEEASALLQGVVVASIGPITAELAARHGITSHIVPENYTIPTLAEALIKHFRPTQG
ncbi:MAG: uroporphyrinogen-III C-methyltransferase [candidate division NC10 bacterium]|nr:uroporphyrinogen-III C-methyltransferase [candidate division NC10 bacterium]